MGCTTSQADIPIFGTKSPSIDCLDQTQKNKIRKIIQKDNLIELAFIIQQLKAPLNVQISQLGLKWMMTHLCCRYNAAVCLEYLLKHYFVQNSSKYIDFVNAPTIEGFTALHLCAIWKNQKCFNVLYYYGGLQLNALDKNKKTPGQLAVQNKLKKMAEILTQNKEMNIVFTIVQTQKLIKGDIISSNPQQSNAIKDQQSKKSQQNQTKLTQQQIKLKNDKKQLQKQLDTIIQKRIEKQAQVQKQKLQITKNTTTNQIKPQVLKQKQQIEKNIDQNLKVQRQKFNLQIKNKQDQLNKVQTQIRQLEEIKINQQKAEAQKKLQDYSKQKQQTITNIIKNKNQAVQNLKASRKISVNQNPQMANNQKVVTVVAQKPQKQKQKKNIRSALTQTFQQMQQKLPPQIQKLYQEAQKQGSFTDKQFPAQNSSIGDKSNPSFANFKSTIVWLRPSQIFQEGTQYQLFSQGIDSNDIQQGQLGVCYLLAAISSLAQNPAHIQKMFVFTDIQIGFYVIKLFINGKPKYFVIDDLIPCDKNTNFPVFTQPVGNQLWVMLIQKCWAKAIGSYLSAEGMVPDQMMEDLTSAPGFGRFLEQNQQSNTTVAQNIQNVVDDCNAGFSIVLTSKQKKVPGFVQGHAYTLMKCYKINNKNVFKVRNPWGNTQWQGDYSQKSKTFTADIKKQLQYTNEDDGVFFLSQKQLLKAFSYYSVNVLLDTHVYSYHQFTSKRQQDKYFKFTLTEASATNVRITQLFQRMLKDKSYQYSPVVFEIGKIENKKIKFLGQGDSTTPSGAKSVHAFENVTEQLQAGDYFVRVRILWKNQKKYNAAVLSVYATHAVKIQQIDAKTGLQYLKQLFLSHAESLQRSPVDDEGTGYFKIDTMKGQFICIAQTETDNNFNAEFQFYKDQMQGTRIQLGKQTNLKMNLAVSKNQPGIGTAILVDPFNGGTTGEVSVVFNLK